MYRYPGHKYDYQCPVCNSKDVETCFVELIKNEWTEVETVNWEDDISNLTSFFINKIEPSLYDMNSVHLLDTVRKRCTSREIRSFVKKASEATSQIIKSRIETLITTNHLLDILDSTFNSDKTFENNVHIFLDAVVNDVARNPTHHEYYYPLFETNSTLFTLTDFVHEYFSNIPEEYSSKRVLFAVETQIGNQIQDVESRLIDMLYQ